MKLFKFIFKLIAIILVLVIILAGVTVFMVYDNKNTTSEAFKNYTGNIEDEESTLVYNALKDTSETSKIDVSFKEESLNYFLATIANDLDNSMGSKINIKDIYVTFNQDGTKSFNMFFAVYGFPSSFKGNLEIKEENNSIILEVHKASIGKITANNKQIGKILSYFIKSDDINEQLVKNGISVDFNLKMLKITLQKDDLQNMLTDLFKDDTNKDLYTALIDILFTNDDFIEFYLSNQDKFGLALNLSDLAYSTSYHTIPYSFDYETIKNKCITLLTNNIININQVAPTFDYLVRGYEKIKDKEDYSFIISLNLTSIGIVNNTEYDGILVYNNKDMKDILLEQVPTIQDLTNPSFNIKIYESDLNNILFKSGVIGTSYAFASKINNEYKINYFYIEALYTCIFQDNMDIIIVININGMRLAMKFTLYSASTAGVAMDTVISAITFGSISLNESQKNAVISYLSKITSGEDWFKVNVETKHVTIDFVELLNNTEEFNLLLQHTTTSKTEFNSATEDLLIDPFLRNRQGYIRLSFELTI